MIPASITSRTRKWLIALFSVLGFISVLAVVEATWLPRVLPELIAARTGRHIQVNGPLELHLLSPRPSFVARDVTIGNPRWMPPGVLARIGQLSVEFDFPRFGGQTPIRRIEMTGARLHLVRDAEGRSNWASAPPNPNRHGEGRLIRSLSMPAAEVALDDARRHLQFNGRVSAREVKRAQTRDEAPRLRIEGTGQLNGKPVQFDIQGDPLATVRRGRPYRFTFDQRWDSARLTANGALLRPFDVGLMDAMFEASGSSMRDLYRMIGVPLPESAPFTLSGKLARRHTRSTFSDLRARYGDSDTSGTIVTSTVDGKRRFDADVHAKLFRVRDLGRQRAATSDDPPAAQPGAPLLPNTPLPFNVVRNRNGLVKIRADNFVAGRVEMREFAATATIANGKIDVPNMQWRMGDARVSGKLNADASAEAPKTHLDVTVAGLQLGRFTRKDLQQPPFEGPVFIRLQVDGRGDSLRQFAASANGTLAAVLPHGAMRASLAELAGPSLRGVGLALSKNSSGAEVRCAVAQFQVKDGLFQTRQFLIDTKTVLIRGSGTVDLRSEVLDLTFRGEPKTVRLGRIRSPLFVSGPMRNPSFGLSPGALSKQAGAAILLGAVAPVAAALAFVDPGLTQDANCPELMNAAGAPP
jgi:AsmA family protein